MSSLFSAVNKSSTRTQNGMRTQATSESPVTDLYYKWGGSRGRFSQIAPSLSAALAADRDLAVRVLLNGRDAREGVGERQLFKDSINFMAENELVTTDEARRIMARIPDLGRWDDLFVFVGTSLEEEAFALIAEALFKDNNGLAAKWMPRKGPFAVKLRKFLGLSPKRYRKALVERTSVVETQMCAKDWEKIDFSKVPSVAASRYMKAFKKNAGARYEAYKAALVKGDDPKVKVNAGAVYPYDVIRALRKGDAVVASEQWKALPDYMEGSEWKNILPVVDVSGSMAIAAAGGGWASVGDVTCMDVAISIGLYVSERNFGVFKDEFITFSRVPMFVRTTGTLAERVHQYSKLNFAENTNLHAVFDLVLSSALRYNLPEAEMPRTILIISDMQFDFCVAHDDSAIEMIKRKYRNAGYPVPNVVFWNVSTNSGVPVSHNDKGVALVSGCSPAVMKAVINTESFTPENVMKQAVMNPRYDW